MRGEIESGMKDELSRFVDIHEWSASARTAALYTGFHMINVFLKSIAELERPAEDICKNDCEFYEGCLEKYTHKKHAEESGEWEALTKKEMWETIQEIRTLVNSDGTKSIISDLQQYAESYHAKKCAEVLSSAADRAMAVYARDCDGCSPRLSDDCDERCPYIAKIRRAITEAPRA